MKYCNKCLMPDTRPRIQFNEEEICNACTHSESKKKIDWKLRKKEFLDIILKIKNRDKKFNNKYDCIVPWSGGKDSSTIAYKLKFEYDLNPLLVTFSPLILNELGNYNRELLIKAGFDSIFIKPNNKISKKLSKRFFIERGNPKVAWDAGINSTPVQLAINFKIPFIFYAEHGESEYGGLILDEKSQKLRKFEEVIEHQIGDHPENWVSNDINLSDLAMYIYPEPEILEKNNINAYYFSYFFKWSMFENYKFISEKLPEFKTVKNGKTDGTFTNFDSLDDKIDNIYYYMQYIKFGFGRATRDACRMIQNNQMTRKEGLELVKKYDHELPKLYFKDSLDFLDMNEIEFFDIVNKHRNNEIWEQNNNDFKLRFPPK